MFNESGSNVLLEILQTQLPSTLTRKPQCVLLCLSFTFRVPGLMSPKARSDHPRRRGPGKMLKLSASKLFNMPVIQFN